MSSEHDAQYEYGSLLLVDCGSTTTKALLFDVVEDMYRFVARGEARTHLSGPPEGKQQAAGGSIVTGLRHAIEQIAAITGRRFFENNGELIVPGRDGGAGVDFFGATVSAAEPLACITIGLLEDVSLASARHALSTTYAREVDSFNLADKRSSQEQMQAVADHEPDLILITGGVDGGADQRVLKLVETAATGIYMLPEERRPRVIYAGNVNLREQVEGLLGSVTTLYMADNVRPSLGLEQLDEVARLVARVYEEVKIAGLPGIRQVAGWSSLPLLPTANAFANIIHYFAALYKGGVLGVDLGSDSITLAAARPDDTRLMVRSDLGMGRPAMNILKQMPAEAVAAWLPGADDVASILPETVADFIYHKSLRPYTVPITEQELRAEQALARVVLRQTIASIPEAWRSYDGTGLAPFDLLLAGGAPFAGTARPGQIILMLLDALQPSGIFSVALDRHGVLPALGSLAAARPLAVVQALAGGVLTDLGFVIAPRGRAEEGQKILTIHSEDKRLGNLNIEVAAGTIEVLPLATGQSAELVLQPARGIDVGFGPGKKQKVKLHGGVMGLVIDARGRPLQFPSEPELSQGKMRQWLWDVGG